ncbi:acetyl-CoA carboxylase biotin carboxylase subunit family protein [Sinorhizobium sp. CCBAU 05631]|uniref:ATP-grasp domain-containing protein n=1 Tax=Sinorhizobium sp. CCBAU 05631 TaxID=794846 RepID=UPI0004AF1C15|nr:acetyl-CoA carboxylase biotin carboxylase subunit family protein [Sinorhizobium sp. CCBAU 05631]ASY61071.1 hypothetical protein SS05631_a46880 [Sinorhizobium sp. CCBAU 05631]
MATRALILIEGNINGTGSQYVQAARRLDLHPITLSTDPARYDYLSEEGIEAIGVDTGNFDALVRECSRLRSTYDIAGITCAKESVYATVAKLCRHFELPGPNPVSIERCCDKFSQRQLLAEAGIPVPAYRVAENATDVEAFAVEIGLPVVLKPAVGNGSSGVRLCRNVDELAEHTTYLLGGKHIWRSPPRILVEEFAQGPYYCTEIMGNEVIGIAAGSFGQPPHFVFREFTIPAVLTSYERARIADVSLKSLRALDLGWGPTNIELRWTKLGPVIIEVNPRLAAAPDPQLIQLACGVDVITEHIKLAIGQEGNLRRTHLHTAAVRFLVPERDGILDWIDGGSQAAAVPGVAEVKVPKLKTRIFRRGDYRDILGYVIAVTPSFAETEVALQRAVDLICWSITPFPSSRD